MMTWLWWAVPFALAVFLGVLAIRCHRRKDQTWQLVLGMAVLAVAMGVNRLIRSDSPHFYWLLALEAMLTGVALYWIWRFDHSRG